MVTRNRASLARRAVRCFVNQTWANKELVIVDDGDEDYEPILAPYRAAHTIRYVRLDSDPSVRLGGLRNRSLDEAAGDFLTQWDDDEWYHPTRIERQMQATVRGLGAVVLTNTLCHMDRAGLSHALFHTRLRKGHTPGTILHRRCDVRYPNQSRAEDTVYLKTLSEHFRVGSVEGPHSHLFIRCFHGTNTWDLAHFEGALQHGWADKLDFFWSKRIRADVTRHSAFRLSAEEQSSAQAFLADSRELGLLSAEPNEAPGPSE